MKSEVFLGLNNIITNSKPLASLLVSVQTPDIKPSGTHGPGVHRGLLYHIVGQVAGSILTATVLYAVANKIEVFFPIYIERWNGPMALRVFRLLLHVEDSVVLVHHDDSCALQLLYTRLFVAHDATGLLRLGKIDKFLEGEEEDVVGGDDEKILSPALPNREGAVSMVTLFQTVYGIQQIADGTQAGVVGLRAIIDDGDGLGIMLFLGPIFEDGGKLVVSDDNMLVNVGDSVDVIQHPSQDGAVAYLQQWLGKVFGQFTQSGGVTGGDNYIFHINLAPLSVLQKWISKVSVYSGNMRRYSLVMYSRMLSRLLGSMSAMQAPLNPAPLKRPP